MYVYVYTKCEIGSSLHPVLQSLYYSLAVRFELSTSSSSVASSPFATGAVNYPSPVFISFKRQFQKFVFRLLRLCLYLNYQICRWPTPLTLNYGSMDKVLIKPYTIAKVLCEEGIQVSRFGVHKFLIMYKETGSIGRRPGTGGISKVTSLVKELVEEQMQRDDETTAYQLHQMLVDNGITISLRTILRCRTALGWTLAHIANSSEKQTKSSVWTGVRGTKKRSLMMFTAWQNYFV